MSHASKLIVISAFWTQLTVLMFGMTLLEAVPPMSAVACLFGGSVLSVAFTMLAGFFRSRSLRHAGLCTHFAISFGWAAWAAMTAGVIVPLSSCVALLLCVAVGAACSEVGLELDVAQGRMARRLAELQRRSLEAVELERSHLLNNQIISPRPASPYESGVFSLQ